MIACVDEVFLGLSGNAAEAGLQLISFVDRELNNLVIGDPSKIKQVLMNLIANGIKFTPKGYIKLTVSALPVIMSFSVATQLIVSAKSSLRIQPPM